MAGIANAIGIAAEGLAVSLSVFGLAVALVLIGVHKIGGIVLACALGVGLFFRDPERFPARTAGVVISGADGKVTDIAQVEMPGSAGVRCHRVSVFMSPLNVHVNRAPVAGEVTRVEHTPGQFRAAFRDEASQHNERNLIVFRGLGDHPTALMQVAGYLARRIVCNLRVHDRIESGQRIGLIMFGSRVDHFIPTQFALTVGLGDRVRAGQSVLAELNQ
ncbi:MAG TPA: phosphatidylserine decarboxylase [Candidatus Binataceae bacterium]|nr:phosphatidylserine decarboxylase [Candidatus Binataceae bacterium]